MATYHHRTPEFRKILEETLSWLKPLFGTDEMVLPIHTTGRGALEGVYNNLFGEEDCVLSIANGSFGEMAVKTLRRNHIPCIPCFEGWKSRSSSKLWRS
jgi:aspartate aminotransferase-like enzyme